MKKGEKTIGELINEHEKHAFYGHFIFLLKSKITYFIWQENLDELLKLISKYEKETISRNKKFKDKTLSQIKSRNYLKKFIKSFHNYVASVYSLEEQYKEFLSPTSNLTIKQSFEKMFDKPPRLFIFALRNNITHHTIPPISISVSHRKNQDNKGNTIFVTKGQFNVSKNTILSNLRNSNSKFLKNNKKKNILYQYISKQYKSKLSINLKDVIKNHQKLLLGHIKSTNNQIIRINKAGYQEVEKIYKTIINRQSKI